MFLFLSKYNVPSREGYEAGLAFKRSWWVITHFWWHHIIWWHKGKDKIKAMAIHSLGNLISQYRKYWEKKKGSNQFRDIQKEVQRPSPRSDMRDTQQGRNQELVLRYNVPDTTEIKYEHKTCPFLYLFFYDEFNIQSLLSFHK